MKILIVGFSFVLIAASAGAQTAADSRWSVWLGCWDLVTDELKETLPSPEEAIDANRAGKAVNRRSARICVTPAPSGGVVLNTLVGGQSVLEQTIVADGVERPLVDPECRGTQRAEWSKDSLRLFSHAELVCPRQAPRTVSGFALLAGSGHWIDVQAVTVSSRESVRVRRYRRAADQAGALSRELPGKRLTLEDVKEASTKVSPMAIEAALIETNATFALTGKALRDLDKAGVPDSVVDLMVALSYPKSFAVERVARDDRVAPSDFYPLAGGWGLGYPLWAYGSQYGFFGDYYWSPYYYSPFGYRYLGYYPDYFGSIAVVGSGSQGTGTRTETTGRVVNGLGYTRVMSRTAAEQASADSGGQAGSASKSGSGTVSAQGWSGGSSSGSSSGGSSGGGSSDGGGGGRSAVDR